MSEATPQDAYVTDFEQRTSSDFTGDERVIMYDANGGITTSLDDVRSYIGVICTDPNSDGNVVITA